MKPDTPTTKDRVHHVLRAIDLIQIFTSGHSQESFSSDEKTFSASLYQFAIIAEASSHIESSILEKYSYPWYKVKSFRNFILHQYHGIERRVIWNTIPDVLPGLKAIFEEILEKEF